MHIIPLLPKHHKNVSLINNCLLWHAFVVLAVKVLSYLLSKSMESKQGSLAYALQRAAQRWKSLSCSWPVRHRFLIFTYPHPLRPKSKARAFMKPPLTWSEVIAPFSEFSKHVVYISLRHFCHTLHYNLITCLDFYLLPNMWSFSLDFTEDKDSFRARILVYSS